MVVWLFVLEVKVFPLHAGIKRVVRDRRGAVATQQFVESLSNLLEWSFLSALELPVLNKEI